MKLRNKKTGKVVEAYKEEPIDLFIYLGTDEEGDELDRKTYRSLAELNEEWEDYKPKEPLIEDEKIRKAVRAVADITGVSMLFYEYNEYNEMIELSDMNGQILIFKSKKLPVKDKDSYTIAELCGGNE